MSARPHPVPAPRDRPRPDPVPAPRDRPRPDPVPAPRDRLQPDPDLTPRDRPRVNTAAARALARAGWGLRGRVRELDGDVDRNFEIATVDGGRYVLKLSFPDGVPLEVRQAAVEQIAASGGGLLVPAAVPTLGGALFADATASDGRACRAVVTRWLPGIPLAEYRPHDAEVLRALGRAIGDVAVALAGFDHPSLERSFDWEPRRGADVVAAKARNIERPEQRSHVERHMARWREFAPRAANLPLQAIHGDANDHNVLVSVGRPSISLIDFGDLSRSWRVADVAIAAAYAVMGSDDPARDIAHVAAGYAERIDLTEDEADAIPLLVALRLCVSVATSAFRGRAEPDDPYMVTSERPAWELLEKLDGIHPRLLSGMVRAACGMEPSPSGARVRRWLSEHGSGAAPVILPAPDSRTAVIDLSVGSVEFDDWPGWADSGAWTRQIERRLEESQAWMGVGRYLEPRLCYAADQFATPGGGAERTRTIHLGTDLFAPAGTTVCAPFDGVVESVVDNARPLDYGPTVVLLHPEHDGRPEFRTLFGHLSRDVLRTLRPGDRVRRGDPFAALGTPEENGGWPPHLHVQVIADGLDRSDGDWPGAALPREAAFYAAACPNPDLFLRLGEGASYRPVAWEWEAEWPAESSVAGRSGSGQGDLEVCGPGEGREGLAGEGGSEVRGPRQGLDVHAILARRAGSIGPGLSVSYRRPLHIVRGIGAYLFDAVGRRYLDGVNNVSHVGHAHPAVVRAARRQMAVLNTNTRYLNRLLPEFAEAILATMPPPLEVCYFVNSGSEANDLALRLAHAATRRRGIVAVEGGYHGNLGSLIDISSYKFDGPGGTGRPEHVRLARLPDPYRGEIRGTGPDVGARYAEDVERAAAELQAAGFGAAAFIAEPIPSCGGQVVPPSGWLAAAAAHARRAGALFIADEVQSGFGRLGTHWWAFEAFGAVPDIVTLGKPIGNGHPMGAVVATRAVAERFATGMEYFSTFGGNPVSCATGLAVLDVIQTEHLREHASEMGARLLCGLRELQAEFPILGDVRGLGLFLGAELVLDPDVRTPAPEHAAHLVNRMRDLGVLLATDGPDHNVVKIKPPLVIGPVDVDRMLDDLRTVLRDTYLSAPATRV